VKNNLHKLQMSIPAVHIQYLMIKPDFVYPGYIAPRKQNI